MSVLINDMEKPKSCYAVIDGEFEYCPFVNTDDDCVLLLKKGTCEGTWEEQYSKCPLVEAKEPCEDAVSRQAVYAVIEEVLYETTKGADNWYGLLNDGVRTLPSVTPKPEQPEVMSDGTLHITVDLDISKIDRILLSQKDTHYGNLYYVDGGEADE